MDLFVSNDEAIKKNRIFVEAQNKIQSFIYTGTISTSQFDAFRQGIELTQQRYYDAGTAKIFAGEPGHVINRDYVGDSFIFRDKDIFFKEIDTFSTNAYINAQDNIDSLNIFYSDHTWPVVTNDCDLATLYDFDGIIEPLTIRDVVTFRSNDLLSNIHSVKGNALCGCVDVYGMTSDVSACDFFKHNNNNSFVDSSNVVELNTYDVFVNLNKVSTLPFQDVEIQKNIPINEIDSNIQNVLNTMTSSSFYTNNDYIRYDQISMATGFIYDIVTDVGTDSLAFGGLTY